MGAAPETNAKVNVIAMPAAIDRKFGEQMKTDLSTYLEAPQEHQVLDFSRTMTLSPTAYQAFTMLAHSLKGAGKKLYSLGLKPGLLTQLKMAGLTQAFNPIESLDSILGQRPGATTGKLINVEFINPFISATQEVLKVQANTESKILKPHIKNKEHPSDIAIAGVLSLVSDKFTGSITLCFPKSVFLKIYSNMFGEEHSEITDEIQDAVGEILNIIYGSAKVILNEKYGHTFQKALPTVLTADNLKIRQTSQSPTIILPFESAAGPFHIEIEVDSNS